MVIDPFTDTHVPSAATPSTLTHGVADSSGVIVGGGVDVAVAVAGSVGVAEGLGVGDAVGVVVGTSVGDAVGVQVGLVAVAWITEVGAGPEFICPSALQASKSQPSPTSRTVTLSLISTCSHGSKLSKF
jgi:hypothetical protein